MPMSLCQCSDLEDWDSVNWDFICGEQKALFTPGAPFTNMDWL